MVGSLPLRGGSAVGSLPLRGGSMVGSLPLRGGSMVGSLPLRGGSMVGSLRDATRWGWGVRGVFVVLEGVEGAGKTTQVGLLGGWLASLGLAHVLTREPGGTPVGEAIREVVLGRPGLDVPVESELLLILAARAAFVRDVVRPALERGEVVVADRFEASTYAYQGYGRGLDLGAVRRLNAFATGGLRPDALLVLDLPASEGLERQRREGKAADRMESEGPAFLERVADGYRALVQGDDRARLVDARGTPDAVHARVRDALRLLLPETFPTGAV